MDALLVLLFVLWANDHRTAPGPGVPVKVQSPPLSVAKGTCPLIRI